MSVPEKDSFVDTYVVRAYKSPERDIAAEQRKAQAKKQKQSTFVRLDGQIETQGRDEVVWGRGAVSHAMIKDALRVQTKKWQEEEVAKREEKKRLAQTRKAIRKDREAVIESMISSFVKAKDDDGQVWIASPKGLALPMSSSTNSWDGGIDRSARYKKHLRSSIF